MDEFEDREKGTLGELPPAILRERREGYPKTDPYPSPVEPPSDVAIERDLYDQAQQGRIGVVQRSTDVTTVFDARPINARDFYKGTQGIISNPEGGGPEVLIGTYTVPDGYVGILRNFRIQLDPYPLNSEQAPGYVSHLILSVTSDNSLLPDYTELVYPLSTLAEWTPVYGISGAQRRIAISARYNVTPSGQGNTVFYGLIEMQGNLLLDDRGLPSNETPGNLSPHIKRTTRSGV